MGFHILRDRLSRIKRLPLCLAAIALLYSNGFGGYSALFMSIPNGVRETGMGETGVSHAGGGAAAWWNPALIATDETEIGFHVFRWIAEGRGSFGGARFKTGWGGLGAYYFNHGMDGFEARDRPGPSQGTFSVHQTLFAGGSAFRFNRGFSAGVVYKRAFDNMYGDRKSGYHALDLGLSWAAGMWSVGAALANIELSNDDDDSFPTTFRAGMIHQRDFGQYSLKLSVEASVLKDDSGYYHYGLEAGWLGLLFLRGGYMSGHDSRDLSFGFGVKYSRYRADISVTPFDNSLGTVWRCGLDIVI